MSYRSTGTRTSFVGRQVAWKDILPAKRNASRAANPELPNSLNMRKKLSTTEKTQVADHKINKALDILETGLFYGVKVPSKLGESLRQMIGKLADALEEYKQTGNVTKYKNKARRARYSIIHQYNRIVSYFCNKQKTPDVLISPSPVKELRQNQEEARFFGTPKMGLAYLTAETAMYAGKTVIASEVHLLRTMIAGYEKEMKLGDAARVAQYKKAIQIVMRNISHGKVSSPSVIPRTPLFAKRVEMKHVSQNTH